jgi:hypothetical protein
MSPQGKRALQNVLEIGLCFHPLDLAGDARRFQQRPNQFPIDRVVFQVKYAHRMHGTQRNNVLLAPGLFSAAPCNARRVPRPTVATDADGLDFSRPAYTRTIGRRPPPRSPKNGSPLVEVDGVRCIFLLQNVKPGSVWPDPYRGPDPVNNMASIGFGTSQPKHSGDAEVIRISHALI